MRSSRSSRSKRSDCARRGDRIMRFMIVVKATKDSEAGVMPHEKILGEMAKYHEELQKAGVLQLFVVLRHLAEDLLVRHQDRKSTRLNSSHGYISYAVFCLKKKKTDQVY